MQSKKNFALLFNLTVVLNSLYDHSSENLTIQTNEKITLYDFEITPVIQRSVVFVVVGFLPPLFFFWLFNVLYPASPHQDPKKKKKVTNFRPSTRPLSYINIIWNMYWTVLAFYHQGLAGICEGFFYDLILKIIGTENRDFLSTCLCKFMLWSNFLTKTNRNHR